MPDCPRITNEDMAKCKNCIVELGDRIFRRKVLGGPIDAPALWCDEVRDIATFLDKTMERNQELYDTLAQITSSPVDVEGEEFFAHIHPALWKKAITQLNGFK